MTIRAPKRSGLDFELELPSGRAAARRSSGLGAVLRQYQRRAGRSARAARPGRIAAPLATASSRRVTIKVRIVQLGNANGSSTERFAHSMAKKAATNHFAYLERDGVEKDGSPGVAYDGSGRLERAEFETDIEAEQRQFRIIISPEDGNDLDLERYVQTYMQRIEEDLGRKLIWVAVNHYNTDNPHAHVVIRGVDADGREVLLDPEYVSHGLRHVAQELATRELGPVPALERRARLQREVGLLRYTSLDAALERRAVDGVFRERPRDSLGRHRDPHWDPALRKRLEVLEGMGLATWRGRDEWSLAPTLGADLRRMQRHAEALGVIQKVLPVDPGRCRIIDRDEPAASEREAFERGVQGVLRWKGLDEAGRFCVVVETISGVVYHLPVAQRVANEARVGQVLEIKRAVDKDARIEEGAAKNGRRYDLQNLSDEYREAYGKRLEQLERLKLATRDGKSAWIVKENFRASLNDDKPQAYWQMLSLRTDPQPFGAQRRFAGLVWIDGVALDTVGATGFGKEVRNEIGERHDYLRAVGLEPQSPKLRWELRDVQQRELERTVAVATGRRPVRAHEGFEGVAKMHRGANGQRFLMIHSKDSFAVVPAWRQQESFDGQAVRLQAGEKGQLTVVGREAYEKQHQQREARALAQIAAVVPHAVSCRLVDGGARADGVATELDTGVSGIVRWVGSTGPRAAHAIVETPSGTAYYVPVSAAVAEATRAGQLVEIQRAPSNDERIHQTALANDGVYDLAKAPESVKAAYRGRLEELERLRLATRAGEGQWRLSESFLRAKPSSPPRPVWLRAEPQSLEEQKKAAGMVWLDRARGAELAASGFGAVVREALRERDEHLRALGVDPESKNLRWNLRDVQQRQLERAIENSTGARPVRAREGFGGVVHVHRASDEQTFLAVHSTDGFVLVPASRGQASLEGQDVRLHVGEKGRIAVIARADYELHHEIREKQALEQIAVAVPNAVRREIVDGRTPAAGVTTELEQGVRGIVRWVGTDGRGAAHAVIETPAGTAYHVPLSAKAGVRSVGQLVQLQRAPDTDESLRQTALRNAGIYDLAQATEAERHVHRRRLEGLEPHGLATRVGEGQWRLSESMLRPKAPSPPRPLWIAAEAQSLEEQKKHHGFVWLDRARGAELAASGFGETLREALRERDEHLRRLRIDPEAKNLRWKLRDLQQHELGQSLVAAGAGRLDAAKTGFEGTLRVHRAPNGERFVEIRNGDRFVLAPAPARAEAHEGKLVRVEAADRGPIRVVPIERTPERGR